MYKKKLTFEEVSERAIQHITARKWDKSNDSRGLAISLSLEANELLEYFQWSGESFGDTNDLASELADIFIYAIQVADRYNIDILAVIQAKLDKSAEKYPVEIFNTEDEVEKNRRCLEAKRKYKKERRCRIYCAQNRLITSVLVKNAR